MMSNCSDIKSDESVDIKSNVMLFFVLTFVAAGESIVEALFLWIS